MQDGLTGIGTMTYYNPQTRHFGALGPVSYTHLVMERAILLIATCELLESELPKTIVINEAVINAKKFCDDDSYKFINGVLSQVI